METVERLQRRVRDYRAGYRQTLGVLEHAKASAAAFHAEIKNNIATNSSSSSTTGEAVAAAAVRRDLVTKTSLMLGLGEREEEVRQALRDLRTAGVDVVTFGQYLRPTQRHMSVQRYVTPAEFDQWREEAQGMGFRCVLMWLCYVKSVTQTNNPMKPMINCTLLFSPFYFYFFHSLLLNCSQVCCFWAAGALLLSGGRAVFEGNAGGLGVPLNVEIEVKCCSRNNILS